MTTDQLKNLFLLHLQRIPTASEYTLHGKKLYDAFEKEINLCEEKKLISKRQRTDIRIAILLSGHIRKNHIIHGLIENFTSYKTDVFIHTWDNLGIKGSEMDLSAINDVQNVKKEIDKFPNVVKYEIENNAEYIESINGEDKNVIYFNYSSPEKFIKSQLYSINKCWNLLEEHIKDTDAKYDLVIRARFDFKFGEVNIDSHLISEINNYDLIFFPNSDGPHSHPDYASSCQICDKMYHSLGMKYPHVFEHPNVVCDIFAYGSVSSMKKYCSLYNHYDKIAKKFEKKNLRSMSRQKNPRIQHNGKDYVIHDHIEALFYFYGSFPERMLSYYLEDYLLVESKHIKLKADTLR
jgi:hypothetical protein